MSLFTAEDARTLMPDIENNPQYRYTIDRISAAALHGFDQVESNELNPQIIKALEETGFYVYNYMPSNSQIIFTRISWAKNE